MGFDAVRQIGFNSDNSDVYLYAARLPQCSRKLPGHGERLYNIHRNANAMALP